MKVLEFSDEPDTRPRLWRWSSRDEAYATRLRVEFHLDGVVVGARTDMEKVTMLCHWVHTRWHHDGGNEAARPDPISILREAEQGQRFRCAEYSIVLAGCCAALGVPARVLGLLTADCETREMGASHVVTEAFLPDRGRWLFADAQCDVVAGLEGEPIHGIELQRLAAERDERLTIGALSGEDAAAYAADIFPYLHYLQAPLDNRVGINDRSARQLMLVPAGSAEPRVFQGKYPLDHYDFTRSARAFYPVPE